MVVFGAEAAAEAAEFYRGKISKMLSRLSFE